MSLVVVFGALTAALVILALVLLVLWQRARSALHVDIRERAEVERDRIDLELSLAEGCSLEQRQFAALMKEDIVRRRRTAGFTTLRRSSS